MPSPLVIRQLHTVVLGGAFIGHGDEMADERFAGYGISEFARERPFWIAFFSGCAHAVLVCNRVMKHAADGRSVLIVVDNQVPATLTGIADGQHVVLEQFPLNTDVEIVSARRLEITNDRKCV